MLVAIVYAAHDHAESRNEASPTGLELESLKDRIKMRG